MTYILKYNPASYWLYVVILLMVIPVQPGNATDIRGLPSVTIMASSSLTKPMSQLVRQYSADHTMTVTASFDASSILAKRIAEGQEANIFISSNQERLTELKQLGVLNVNSVTTLIGNTMVLAAGKNHPAINTYRDAPARQILEDIASNKLAIGVLVVGDMETVALGKYTKQYLRNSGYFPAISPYFLPVSNSSKALYMVAKGGHLGIIYASDAYDNDEVTVLAELDSSLHDRIIYWAAVVIDEQMEHAIRFLEFLKQDSSQKIFAAHGFLIE